MQTLRRRAAALFTTTAITDWRARRIPCRGRCSHIVSALGERLGTLQGTLQTGILRAHGDGGLEAEGVLAAAMVAVFEVLRLCSHEEVIALASGSGECIMIRLVASTVCKLNGCKEAITASAATGALSRLGVALVAACRAHFVAAGVPAAIVALLRRHKDPDVVSLACLVASEHIREDCDDRAIVAAWARAGVAPHLIAALAHESHVDDTGFLMATLVALAQLWLVPGQPAVIIKAGCAATITAALRRRMGDADICGHVMGFMAFLAKPAHGLTVLVRADAPAAVAAALARHARDEKVATEASRLINSFAAVLKPRPALLGLESELVPALTRALSSHGDDGELCSTVVHALVGVRIAVPGTLSLLARGACIPVCALSLPRPPSTTRPPAGAAEGRRAHRTDNRADG